MSNKSFSSDEESEVIFVSKKKKKGLSEEEQKSDALIKVKDLQVVKVNELFDIRIKVLRLVK